MQLFSENFSSHKNEKNQQIFINKPVYLDLPMLETRKIVIMSFSMIT